jgi:protease-4
MSAERDQLLDRRRLKKKLTLWQIGAIALGGILALVVAGQAFNPDQPHIARISINGMIVDDFAREELIDRLADNENAKAVIVRINSPGGTVAASESLFNGLRAVSESKPTVSFISTIGASGGYITALATDRIFARKNALTGSIGILFQSPEISGLMEKVGVTLQEVKSSPLKGGPSMYAPMSEGERAVIKQMIDDSNEWFIDLVEDRRSMDRATATALADGGVYTGGRAMENNLVDELGGEQDAIKWLEGHEDVPEDLHVVDYKPRQPNQSPLADLLSWAGLGEISASRLKLDGLLALWQL